MLSIDADVNIQGNNKSNSLILNIYNNLDNVVNPVNGQLILHDNNGLISLRVFNNGEWINLTM